ncbi:hypothetical protein Tco_0331928 [Tanacetum coccineum]
MTRPRLKPFPATTPRAGAFSPFFIIFDHDDEITTLPVRPAPPLPNRTTALYGYPLDSGDDSSDKDSRSILVLLVIAYGTAVSFAAAYDEYVLLSAKCQENCEFDWLLGARGQLKFVPVVTWTLYRFFYFVPMLSFTGSILVLLVVTYGTVVSFAAAYDEYVLLSAKCQENCEFDWLLGARGQFKFVPVVTWTLYRFFYFVPMVTDENNSMGFWRVGDQNSNSSWRNIQVMDITSLAGLFDIQAQVLIVNTAVLSGDLMQLWEQMYILCINTVQATRDGIASCLNILMLLKEVAAEKRTQHQKVVEYCLYCLRKGKLILPSIFNTAHTWLILLDLSDIEVSTGSFIRYRVTHGFGSRTMMIL